MVADVGVPFTTWGMKRHRRTASSAALSRSGLELERATCASATVPSAAMTIVTATTARGNHPRSFAFEPTGRFLYCCNQRADNVTVFRADEKTGRAR